MARTTISTRGRITLPKAIHDKHHWKAGTQLTVEERPEGMLLKPVEKKKKKTFTIDDWAGILKYKGPPLTVEDMNAAIERELGRRYARGRYQHSRSTVRHKRVSLRSRREQVVGSVAKA